MNLGKLMNSILEGVCLIGGFFMFLLDALRKGLCFLRPLFLGINFIGSLLLITIVYIAWNQYTDLTVWLVTFSFVIAPIFMIGLVGSFSVFLLEIAKKK